MLAEAPQLVPAPHPFRPHPTLVVKMHAVDQMRRRHPPVRDWAHHEIRARARWMIRRGRNLGGGRYGGCRYVLYRGLVFVVRGRAVITVLPAAVVDLRAGRVIAAGVDYRDFSPVKPR